MKSIRPYNTFALDHKVGAIHFVRSEGEIINALNELTNPIVLGGGSNVLFTADTTRPVILVDNKGIKSIYEDATSIQIDVAAGEVWHEVVLWAIKNNFGGIENLSLIPGKCGAAPMQNIGAYGVELSQVLLYVDCIERSSGKRKRINAEDCGLGYRDSIFKTRARDLFIIYSIGIELKKPGFHQLNTTYGAIQDVLKYRSISNPGIKEVSDAVIFIRQSKLPDPDQLPNAGSFFKNPIIRMDQYRELKNIYPGLPSYPVSEKQCKVPAGWLIDQCGWKGIMLDEVGVHARQALVLVNHGAASGEKIRQLAGLIQASVQKKYNIELTPEVNVLP